MTNKQDLHLAYVLHTRSFRETSLLVEMLSVEHGRVTLVARGAKRGKAKDSSLLQPFIPLQVSWYGAGDLVTLTNVEACHAGYGLHGKTAICGLYINELLIKLVPKWDNCGDLFHCYQESLQQLSAKIIHEQITLRKFELRLLKSLGYALQLSKDIDTGNEIQADKYYIFDPVLGPKLVHTAQVMAIKGASLLALAAEDLNTPAVLLDVKRLMRTVLRHHLGTKELKTRELL